MTPVLLNIQPGLPAPEPGNPNNVDLILLVESLVNQTRNALGVHPFLLLDALLTYIAEDETGGSGVDVFVVRDAEDLLVDVAVYPHDSDEG